MNDDDLRDRFERARALFVADLTAGLRAQAEPRVDWLEGLDVTALPLPDLIDARAEARTLRHVLAGLLEPDQDHRLDRVGARLTAEIDARVRAAS